MSLIIHWAIVALTILAIPYVVPGVRVASLGTAVMAAAVLGVINVIIKPILIFLTLPINLLTLGLFTLVINALLLKLAASLVSGFSIDGFWHALLGGLILSVVSLVFGGLWET
jgi:putative membrane protein